MLTYKKMKFKFESWTIGNSENRRDSNLLPAETNARLAARSKHKQIHTNFAGPFEASKYNSLHI
jgi:hypothetical protein